jgi:hypothetical protein
MAPRPHVPADDDPESVVDLVEDCREVSGVLAPFVPGALRLPVSRPVSPVGFDAAVVAGVADWSDYGA